MDDRRKQIETQFSDAALALMMDDFAEEEGKQLWEAYCEEECCMPAELDARCSSQIQHTIDKTSHQSAVRKRWKSAGRAAACLVVLLCLAGTLVSSVEALRVPVLNFIIRHAPQYTSFLFGEAPGSSLTRLEELLSILKISVPDGYTLAAEHIHRDEFPDPPSVHSVFLAYQDADENILMINVAPAEGTLNIDTEDATITKIILAEQEAMLVEKAPEIRVLWINDAQNLYYDVYASNMEKSAFLEYVTPLSEKILYSNAGLSE